MMKEFEWKITKPVTTAGAADIIGVSPTTLLRRVKKHNIRPDHIKYAYGKPYFMWEQSTIERIKNISSA
jgi:hypothetical protein